MKTQKFIILFTNLDQTFFLIKNLI